MINLDIDYDKLNDAIYKRRSIRAYKDIKLKENHKRFIKNLEEYINSLKVGITINTVFKDNDNGNICDGIVGAYGNIKNPSGYFILIGEKNKDFIEDYIGYIGEYLLLNCVSEGLGTCWISGNLKRTSVFKKVKLIKGQEIYAIILFGYEDNKKILKDKERLSIDRLFCNFNNIDFEKKYIIEAIEAARIAPSLLNRQPWRFEMLEDSIKVKMDKDITKSQKLIKGKRVDIGTSIFHIIVSLGKNNTRANIVLSEYNDVIATINLEKSN